MYNDKLMTVNSSLIVGIDICCDKIIFCKICDNICNTILYNVVAAFGNFDKSLSVN